MGFVADYIHKYPSIALLVIASGGKVHITGYVLPRLDGNLTQDIFCPTPLMGRHNIFEPEETTHRVLQAMEIATTGIRLIAHHHTTPLAIAHCVRATIGKKIDIHVFGVDQERVVAGFLYYSQSLFTVDHGHRFYALDAKRLCGILAKINHMSLSIKGYYFTLHRGKSTTKSPTTQI